MPVHNIHVQNNRILKYRKVSSLKVLSNSIVIIKIHIFKVYINILSFLSKYFMFITSNNIQFGTFCVATAS